MAEEAARSPEDGDRRFVGAGRSFHVRSLPVEPTRNPSATPKGWSGAGTGTPLPVDTRTIAVIALIIAIVVLLLLVL
jgi:hypothetical protein